jgi:hypothetical protein
LSAPEARTETTNFKFTSNFLCLSNRWFRYDREEHSTYSTTGFGLMV